MSRCPDIQGLTVSNRKIKITQLADDMALFLRDKWQIQNALYVTGKFSEASGLKLSINKSEILCLHENQEQFSFNIPGTQCVIYLGNYISKDPTLRQQLNFSLKMKKTKSILNMWLQRDLSVSGRVLLTKAEGISRFVYPTLSLYVNDVFVGKLTRCLFISCGKIDIKGNTQFRESRRRIRGYRFFFSFKLHL